MPTYEAERKAVRADRDWGSFVRRSDSAPTRKPKRRTTPRHDRDHTGRPVDTYDRWRNLDDYERRQDEENRAKALQPRWYYAPRAHSADFRGTLAPEPPTAADERSKSDPQTPRFEDITDKFEEFALDEGAVSDASDANEYEIPPTLLGQAEDCVRELARAIQVVRPLDDTVDIGSRCEDSLFRLKVWISETKLENIPAMRDIELEGELITLASSILYRLRNRIVSLEKNASHTSASSTASFNVAEPVQKDIDDDASGSDSGIETSNLPPDSLTPIRLVRQDLKQVEFQIRTLRRLTRTLRTWQQDEENVAISKHVMEVSRFFGTNEDSERWKEEIQGMPADAALKTVRAIVAGAA